MSARARADWLAHVAKAVLTSPHAGLGPVLRPLIPEEAVVIDVGAHSGATAKVFAALARRGRVFAFEPGPYALSVLRITVSACGLRNVEIVPMGLSDAPGRAVLHMPVKARGGYGFGLSHLAAPDGSRPVVEAEITLTTLDAFEEDRGLTRLDFIKADIEGFEARFLEGARNVLRRFRPACLLEVDERLLARAGATPADVFAAFAPLGYAVRKLQAGAVAGYEGPGDYLFTPNALEPHGRALRSQGPFAMLFAREGGMVRAILGAVVGIFVAVLTIAVLEALSHLAFPPPQGLEGPLTPEDLKDHAALEEVMRATPLPAKIAVVVGWAIGAFAGAGAALRISGGKAWAAALPPAIVFAGAVLTITTVPHPLWMTVSAVIAIPLAGFLALRAFGPRRAATGGAL